MRENRWEDSVIFRLSNLLRRRANYRFIDQGIGRRRIRHITNLLAAGGNVYVTQGSYYKVFRSGQMANGTAFDDTLYLDALVAKLAAAVMNQLTTLAKVPQTEDL